WAYSDNRNEFYILQERQSKALAQQSLERQQRQQQRQQRQQQRQQRELEQQQRQRELEQQPPAPGFKLHHTLRGHTEPIIHIAWSLDGRLLASASRDHTIPLWDIQTTHLLHTLSG